MNYYKSVPYYNYYYKIKYLNTKILVLKKLVLLIQVLIIIAYLYYQSINQLVYFLKIYTISAMGQLGTYLKNVNQTKMALNYFR